MQAVVRQAMSGCALDAGNIAAVAVHGTGTPLGDPIEVGALGMVLGGVVPATPVLLVASKAHPILLSEHPTAPTLIPALDCLHMLDRGW